MITLPDKWFKISGYNLKKKHPDFCGKGAENLRPVHDIAKIIQIA